MTTPASKDDAATAQPRTEELTHKETFRLLRRSLRYILPLWPRVLGKIALSCLGFIPTLLLPWPGKVIVDQVVSGIPPEDSPTSYPFFFQPFVDAVAGLPPAEIALWVFVFVSATLVLLGAWSVSAGGRDYNTQDPVRGEDTATRSEQEANYAYSYSGGLFGWFEYVWTLRLTHAFNHLFRSRLFEALQRLPMTSLDDQRIGDAIYRVMYDTPSISAVCYRGIVNPLVRPIEIVIGLWVLSLTYGHLPSVMGLVTAVVPVTLLATFPFSRALRRQAEVSRMAGATTTTTMEETSSNILAVQSLGAQRKELARFDADSWRSFGEYRKWLALTIAMRGTAIAGGLGLGTFAYFALTDLIFAGELTVGDLGVIVSLLFAIGFLAAQIGVMWIELQTSAAGLKRVFAVIDLPSDHEPAQARPLPAIERGYRFEGVSFRYPDGTQALSEIELTAERGKMIALAGPAGAGKTTLAYMFPRFLWPAEGRILVDGVDLAEVSRDALRKQVSFVFQEAVLLDASIADNIRVGKPDATLQEMRRAAATAGALEFIERMPDGFDTQLGRSGGRLSVGQKQRLSIARALVRDAPVLILDEPTAALDPETEHQLIRTLAEVSQDKLVIVIAHRLSTIRHADEILFIAEGRIRERGSHAELMKKPDGAYRRFVELQTEQAA